jgi:phytoene synthase
MDGSADVVGEMILLILEAQGPRALEPARKLTRAFQLTNFLRDVGEDRDRGRVYLTPGRPLALRHRPVVPARRRQLARRHALRDRTGRRLYAAADDGIALLPACSARSITTARVLYARILDEIEANDYDVFSQRARVSTAGSSAWRHVSPWRRPEERRQDPSVGRRDCSGRTGLAPTRRPPILGGVLTGDAVSD